MVIPLLPESNDGRLEAFKVGQEILSGPFVVEHAVTV